MNEQGEKEKMQRAKDECFALLEGKVSMNQLCNISDTELETLYCEGYNAWNNGDIETAAQRFAFVAMQRPNDRRFIFAFACVLKQAECWASALSLYGYAIAMQADDPYAVFHVAECLQAVGNIEGARDALDATISLCFYQAMENPAYADLRQAAEAQLSRLNS
ncbi:CesD/SycD/LcrH family type III secretion system chaperone [Enterobacterales bacterium CwR94]|nr:CesD/SycD/LcrH family type III secretion system chaperone [Enterobacterales bacterium CwR94]